MQPQHRSICFTAAHLSHATSTAQLRNRGAANYSHIRPTLCCSALPTLRFRRHKMLTLLSCDRAKLVGIELERVVRDSRVGSEHNVDNALNFGSALLFRC